MTAVPPVFVTVSVSVLLLPTVTVPKLRLLGLGLRRPGETPEPASGMVRVGFDALEAMVMLPLAVVAEVGVNVTLKVAACPAASVRGVEIPLMPNPFPLTEACEIVTLDPPVFVTVSDRELLFPTVTLPKLRLLGFGPRPPGAIPVPLKDTVSVGLLASEVMVSVPVALPVDWGAKVSLRLVLCEGLSDKGTVIPLN